jgi:predicted metalloprotease with PDZ domain
MHLAQAQQQHELAAYESKKEAQEKQQQEDKERMDREDTRRMETLRRNVYLGVSVGENPSGGALIGEVMLGGPAEKAGMSFPPLSAPVCFDYPPDDRRPAKSSIS